MNYIFVILCTLRALADVGVNQNDLHWSNIIMDDVYVGPTRYHLKNYLLVFGDTVLYIDNPYVPFIYDFDRAAIKGKTIGTFAKDIAYPRGGNCPKFHPKRDFLRILCSMYYHLNRRRNDISQDLLTLLRSKYLRDALTRGQSTGDSDCKMSTDRKTGSVLCEKNVFNDVASETEILQWVLSQTNYRRFRWQEISAPPGNALEILRDFKRGIPADTTQQEQIKFITANIQSLQSQSRQSPSFAPLVKLILNVETRKRNTNDWCTIA